MHAEFLAIDDADWRDADFLLAGDGHASGDLDVQVGISYGSGKKLRVDMRVVGPNCLFTEAVCCVADIVYVGYAEFIFVISPEERSVRTHPFEGYFSYIYIAEDLQTSQHELAVLVAGASELLSFSSTGNLLWRSDILAIDGVVIDAVKDGVISGQGEWDPPGGWRPFKLCSKTGEHVT